MAQCPFMCGRYAIVGPHSRYREHFDVETWPDFGDHFNLAPSAWVPVIRQAPDGRRVADLLRWGLVANWAKDQATPVYAPVRRPLDRYCVSVRLAYARIGRCQRVSGYASAQGVSCAASFALARLETVPSIPRSGARTEGVSATEESYRFPQARYQHRMTFRLARSGHSHPTKATIQATSRAEPSIRSSVQETTRSCA